MPGSPVSGRSWRTCARRDALIPRTWRPCRPRVVVGKGGGGEVREEDDDGKKKRKKKRILFVFLCEGLRFLSRGSSPFLFLVRSVSSPRSSNVSTKKRAKKSTKQSVVPRRLCLQPSSSHEKTKKSMTRTNGGKLLWFSSFVLQEKTHHLARGEYQRGRLRVSDAHDDRGEALLLCFVCTSVE